MYDAVNLMGWFTDQDFLFQKQPKVQDSPFQCHSSDLMSHSTLTNQLLNFKLNLHFS